MTKFTIFAAFPNDKRTKIQDPEELMLIKKLTFSILKHSMLKHKLYFFSSPLAIQASLVNRMVSNVHHRSSPRLSTDTTFKKSQSCDTTPLNSIISYLYQISHLVIKIRYLSCFKKRCCYYSIRYYCCVIYLHSTTVYMFSSLHIVVII